MADKVEVIAEATADQVDPAIYPIGLIEDKEASDAEVKAAEEFKEYVATDPSPMELLTAAGFNQIK